MNTRGVRYTLDSFSPVIKTRQSSNHSSRQLTTSHVISYIILMMFVSWKPFYPHICCVYMDARVSIVFN